MPTLQYSVNGGIYKYIFLKMLTKQNKLVLTISKNWQHQTTNAFQIFCTATIYYSGERLCNVVLNLYAQSSYGDDFCFGPLMHYFKEQRNVDSCHKTTEARACADIASEPVS